MVASATRTATDTGPVLEVDTLVIGAGPSGLTAADRLMAAGHHTLVIERSMEIGGLMRSLRRGPFRVDLGRKELYSRIPEIDTLWRTLLGEEYRPYSHRVGSLFGGRILEMSGGPRGAMRGIPPELLVPGAFDLLRGWVGATLRKPWNYESFWYARVGRSFAQALAQGYWEKFRGQRWRDMPVPDELADGQAIGSQSFAAIVHGLRLAARGGPTQHAEWRHPRLGTGQLPETLAARFERSGGTLRLQTEAVALALRPDRRVEATIVGGGATTRCIARNLVSSQPVEALIALLDPAAAPPEPDPASTRAVMLVYLFLDERPRFPHAWLEVNDPKLDCGRITNYAAFGGAMVPEGATALCVETFLQGDDPRLAWSESEWIDRAVTECTSNGLIDPGRLTDTMVLRLDRCNAAASWREAQDNMRRELFQRLHAFPAVYHVHRPGTDWASFAGLRAAEAILTGDRRSFDRRADPARSYSVANNAHDDEEGEADAPCTIYAQ